MGAALRTSSNQQVQYSWLSAVGPDKAAVTVSFETCDLPEAEKSCWTPLFANPTIAEGFPVHKRDNEEQGLEIPLEMMAALGGARYITDYEGGLVLKGFSAMFVPVKRYKQSVQWHLIFDKQGKGLPYRELRNLPSRRALLDDHDFLRGARAFLGWWKAAETHLGTQEAAYESINWSSAIEARRPIRFSGAGIGIQWIGIGNLNFTIGKKEGPFHFSGDKLFRELIKCASDTPVTLYDLQDRRAWLVPALDVMLHIIHTRHHITPYQIGGRNVELPTAAPQEGCSAEDAILKNQQLTLYEADSPGDKDSSFKDAIIDMWSQMEFLQAKQEEGASGLTLHATTRTKLHGWEFMSLVRKKNYRLKEAPIEKSSGGWVDLIDDLATLVLMGTGFRDVIRPVSDLNMLCRKWRTMPLGKDYLAVSVVIIEVLYTEAGSQTSRKHLSNNHHLKWHRGSTLFESCTDPNSEQCGCDRTQQIYHDSPFKTVGKVRPPEKNLENTGSVIFGQARHSLKPAKTVTNKENPVHNLSNIPLVIPTTPPNNQTISPPARELGIPTPAVTESPKITPHKNRGSPPPTFSR